MILERPFTFCQLWIQAQMDFHPKLTTVQMKPHEFRMVLQKLYVGLPDAEARASMFKVHLRDASITSTAPGYADLAACTEGFSSSDIAAAVRGAVMEPLRQTREANFFRSAPCIVWTFSCVRVSTCPDSGRTRPGGSHACMSQSTLVAKYAWCRECYASVCTMFMRV